MKKLNRVTSKLCSVVLIWAVAYIVASFATYDLKFPFLMFDYIAGRGVFLCASIIIFYVIPPVHRLLETIEP